MNTTTRGSQKGIKNKIRGVVLGASAGGIEALLEILASLPKSYSLPVIVVIHLPSGKPSLLVDVFDRQVKLPVREPEDHEVIKPGVIYFAPPNYHLLVDQGELFSFSHEEAVNYSRPSIDVLFEAAADLWKEGVAGVLLTGANHDGASGLRAIQEKGGITVVQDPQSAQTPIMPLEALRLFTPDHVLNLQEIAEFLAGLQR